MNRTTKGGMGLSTFVQAGVVGLMMVFSTSVAFAQPATKQNTKTTRELPAPVKRALDETNKASQVELAEVERKWREIFCNARSRERLEGFVDESLDLFEKLQQLHDFAVKPSATEERIGGLFRKRILDEETLCNLLEKDLTNFCRDLDEQDRALMIKAKIDRDLTPTQLSRSAIDSKLLKDSISQVALDAAEDVKNDLSRSVAAFVASEAISAGFKQAAQEMGIMPDEPGSIVQVLSGLIIDIGIGMAVDAATDPTEKMVADLDSRLQTAEREILDGTDHSPGLLRALQRLTKVRSLARQKLLEAEYCK